MSTKTTTFISAHYPNTYMEQFCRSIHPDLELGPVCVSWFRLATNHCTKLMTSEKVQGSFFWTTVKNFIFPEIHTDLMSQKIPIRIHPNHLSMQDCQSLFLDIVNDYVLRAPRYAAESTANVMLWQVLYSLTGIVALGSMLMGVMAICNRYGRSKESHNIFQDVFEPQKLLKVVANRSLGMAKTELRRLQVIPMVQPEELIAPDGSVVLALKVNSKFDLLESVVTGSVHSTGRLFRMCDKYSKIKPDYKVETIKKALQFVRNTSKKLRLLIIFDDDPYVDNLEQLKCKEKSSSISKNRKVNILMNYNKIETIASSSQRTGGKLKKTKTDIPGDSESPRCGVPLQRKPYFTSLKPLHSESPRKLASTSPRSGNKAISGIPRGAGILSPTTKK